MTRQEIKFKKGETIFKEGDQGDCMYFVKKGAIEIYRLSSDGRVVLATLGPGEFFGEMAILNKTTRTATALVASDCQVTEVKDTEFQQFIESRPATIANMIHTLVKRVKLTTDRLMNEREKMALMVAVDKWLKEEDDDNEQY